MYNKLILLLLRKKFGLKKYQLFKFNNQKTNNRYYFNDYAIIKVDFRHPDQPSNIKLSYLLSDECKITKFKNTSHLHK